MQCTNPIRIFPHKKKPATEVLYPQGIEVPCGKCVACRMRQRKEWSIRLLFELSGYDDASFVTLTYDDEHIPENGSLKKSDFQKFMKRLRRLLDAYDVKIKYYACGEYGDNTNRPHYHAILFGLSVEDSKTYIPRVWYQGHIDVGTVTPASINYVCGYIDKKLSGIHEYETYISTGRENVFRLLSNGLGRDYFDSISDEVIEKGYLSVQGKKYSLPRYFLERLKKQGKDLSAFRALSDERSIVMMEKLTGLTITQDDYIEAVGMSDLYDSFFAKRKQANRNYSDALKLKNRQKL